MSETDCLLSRAVQTHPDAPAIVTPGRAYTYAAYDAAVSRTAARLRELGVGPGDVFALALYPSAECLFALMALFRIGAAACLISPRWPVKAMASALRGLPCSRLALPVPISIEGLSTYCVEDLTRDAGPATAPPAMPQGATVLFTSGSAGAPKAAMHAYAAHAASARASNRNIPIELGDRWLLSLALHHVAGIGIVFRCLAGGGAVVIPGPGDGISEAIARYGVTHVSLVSTQLYRLIRQENGPGLLKKIKAILLGGSAIPGTLICRAHELGLPIYTSYGLTEMASQVTTSRKGDPIEKLLTSGKALNPDTVTVSLDGEILVRGETLFSGYLCDGGLERPMTPDGWFATGDLGHLDRDGYLTVQGRKDNMFISGGENIQPEEIERALCRIAPVVDAVVVPVDDDEFGSVSVAFVRTEGDVPIIMEAVAGRLRQELPGYKLPKRFLPWPGTPGERTAKVDRGRFTEFAQRLTRPDA